MDWVASVEPSLMITHDTGLFVCEMTESIVSLMYEASFLAAVMIEYFNFVLIGVGSFAERVEFVFWTRVCLFTRETICEFGRYFVVSEIVLAKFVSGASQLEAKLCGLKAS